MWILHQNKGGQAKLEEKLKEFEFFATTPDNEEPTLSEMAMGECLAMLRKAIEQRDEVLEDYKYHQTPASDEEIQGMKDDDNAALIEAAEGK